MKLATFAIDGHDRIGVVHVAEMLDLQLLCALWLSEEDGGPDVYERAEALVPTDMARFLEEGAEALAAAELSLDFAQQCDPEEPLWGPCGETIAYPLESVKLRPPVPRPGKLICIGRNYKGLYKEGEPYHERPMSWLTPSSSIIGHEDPIVRPIGTRQLDYEVELAVVIGTRGKHIPPQRALEYVAGYTVLNDLMDVELLHVERAMRTRFLQKALDTFNPMGPFLVTSDEIADPQNLDLELRVNGQVRQQSNTREMVCGVREAIVHFSQLTLEPGDVISTGTPAGVAWQRPDPEEYFLKPGDVVEARVEGVGTLRNHVVDEEDVAGRG